MRRAMEISLFRHLELREAMGLMLLLGALVVSIGCQRDGKESQEGMKVKEAFEKFIEFGMSNESYDLGRREHAQVTAKIRRRTVNSSMAPRVRLELDIELPYDMSGRALEQAMLENARRALAGTEYQAVRVKAWPGSLERVAGIMGYAVLAVDGLGWDGERVGHREVKITLGDASTRPNAFEYRILCAVEEELAKLETERGSRSQRSDPSRSRGSQAGKGKGWDEKLLRKAEASVARVFSIDEETVRTAVRKAEKYYLKE